MTILRMLLLYLVAMISLPLSGEGYCLPFFGEIGVGYDYFRSLPEGDWEGNTGGVVSLNMSRRVTTFPEYGIQLGGSYGVYDFYGRLSAPSGRQKSAQQQVFITAGIFKQTHFDSGFNLGLAYDWMWNKNFGVFALQPKIDQLRFQTGYLVCNKNEFGFWSTIDLHWARLTSQEIPVTYRAISQINAFWKHLFDNCAETVVWAGVPYKRSLMFSTGRAGKFILGGSFNAPLTTRLSIEGHASYMCPHSGSGKQRLYAANLMIELKWAFGKVPNCTQPYLSIGNNSNFIVDTNVNF